jgi:hypothetical protein
VNNILGKGRKKGKKGGQGEGGARGRDWVPWAAAKYLRLELKPIVGGTSRARQFYTHCYNMMPQLSDPQVVESSGG